MKEKAFPEFEKNIPIKQQLLNFCSVSISLIKNEPILYLLEDTFQNLNKDENNNSIVNNLYNKLNRKIIINKSLNKNLAKYFTIYLFIYNKPEILKNVNLSNLILEMNNYQNNIKNDSEKLKKVIISKVITELTNSHEKLKINNIIDKKLQKIEKENSLYFKNNLKILNQLKVEINLDNLQSITAEEIYIKIITSIIQKFNFKKHENLYFNIVKLLELDSINLSEPMINQILKILDLKESYVNKNIIKHSDDLIIPEKINY